MIRKRCDNCDKVIEVEDALAGQKVSCGGCGDVGDDHPLPRDIRSAG
jgi:hypothetical protein